jgi:hypothetical protein
MGETLFLMRHLLRLLLDVLLLLAAVLEAQSIKPVAHPVVLAVAVGQLVVELL